MGPRASELAMEKAERGGTGWVAVGNGDHLGAGEYGPQQALPRGRVGWRRPASRSFRWGPAGSEGRSNRPLGSAFSAAGAGMSAFRGR